MNGRAPDAGRVLSRQQGSDTVTGPGWRYILGLLRTSVRTGSLGQAADVVARAAAAAGGDVGDRLRADVRADRVSLTLQSLSAPGR